MEGGFVSSPTASLVFLAIGAGAIFQVVVVVAIGRFIIHSGGGSLMTRPNVARLSTGMLIMYLTALLI
jgi:ZIP family zinc transporter